MRHIPFSHRWQTWIAKWVDLAVAIAGIVTFSYWMPRWSLQVRGFFIKRRFKRMRETS